MLKASKIKNVLRPSLFGGVMSLAGTALGAGDIEFNTDVLDLNDPTNIDLSQFARSGFILPGTYSMVVQVNNQTISELPVAFYPPDNDPKGRAVAGAECNTAIELKGEQDDASPSLL